VSRDATATREKLLRAAEHLFARRGLDVPIREIHAFAGQRNASAIQYHFGGKQELLDALVERYASRQHDPRSFVDAFVRRQCEYLKAEDTRDYIRVSFHLMQQASMRKILAEGLEHYTLAAVWAEEELLRATLPGLPDRLVRERAVAGMSFIVFEIAERARLIDDGQAEVLLDEEEFIANLVDMATAVLTAPSTLITFKS
jgi:AcrR family transcriptional regulator